MNKPTLRAKPKRVRKQMESAVKKSPKVIRQAEPERMLAKSMAEVIDKPIDWLWYPYLARGELTIVEGDPDLGKSYLVQMFGRYIADGKPLPVINKERKPEPIANGKVAYFDIENHSASVMGQRLTSNGLDIENKNRAKFYHEPKVFSIDDPSAIQTMRDAIAERRPQLVVFDTLNSYIGTKLDHYKANEAQAALNEFREVARDFGCAVIVVRHLTKGKGRAMYRGQGSIAFSAMARVVMQIGTVPEDHIPESYQGKSDLRAISIVKGNNLPDRIKKRLLTYHIEELPDDQSKLYFGEIIEGLNADDLAGNNEPDINKDTKKERAKALLHELLDSGHKVSIDEIKQKFEQTDISWVLVKTIVKEMGIISTQDTGDDARKGRWHLPDPQWLRGMLESGPVKSGELSAAREGRSIGEKLFKKLFEQMGLTRGRADPTGRIYYIGFDDHFDDGIIKAEYATRGRQQ